MNVWLSLKNSDPPFHNLKENIIVEFQLIKLEKLFVGESKI